jgi:TetR/AcrR family transcriptional regulator, cholesterol catabolism regulator
MELIDRIKEQAYNSYKKYGFRSVSMDNIAQELGISKKTIYQYFTDKDSLVDAILCDELLKNKECAICDTQNATNAVHEMFLAAKMMQQTFAQMNPNFLYELKKYHYASFEKFVQFKDKFLYEIIKSNLQRGINEGVYRPEINIEILAAARIESIMLVFNDGFANANKYSILEIELEMILHFLYGIVSKEGLQLIENYKNNLLQ